jgi:hypothetical protein
MLGFCAMPGSIAEPALRDLNLHRDNGSLC